ncbi:YraN family protein [Nocardia sp. XZ_19_369]|uniref:YraN family protein n=1 Tax=Nocardia sp. XZ_19_369 TaxID=2769487 RepID=UPI00188F1894|nr:YraN family protein [Nocardia sp. XZ_19_369]
MDDEDHVEHSSAPVADRPEIDLAADYLRSQGLTVVATRWRCRYGVLDVIAEGTGVLVFAGVLAISGTASPDHIDIISYTRRQRLRALALFWLAEQDGSLGAARFDVVSVQSSGDQPPVITHHRAVY